MYYSSNSQYSETLAHAVANSTMSYSVLRNFVSVRISIYSRIAPAALGIDSFTAKLPICRPAARIPISFCDAAT